MEQPRPGDLNDRPQWSHSVEAGSPGQGVGRAGSSEAWGRMSSRLPRPLVATGSLGTLQLMGAAFRSLPVSYCGCLDFFRGQSYWIRGPLYLLVTSP